LLVDGPGEVVDAAHVSPVASFGERRYISWDVLGFALCP